MREISNEEMKQVDGGISWGEGGLSVIALGIAGGPATAGFGLAIGSSMLLLDYLDR